MSTKTFVPRIGDTVEVRHSRFGKATVKMLDDHGDFVSVRIVKGHLLGATEEWFPGDTKSLRKSHCNFYPEN